MGTGRGPDELGEDSKEPPDPASSADDSDSEEPAVQEPARSGSPKPGPAGERSLTLSERQQAWLELRARIEKRRRPGSAPSPREPSPTSRSKE
jgi:hypothetical protein